MTGVQTCALPISSGDTGSAAIDALAGRAKVDIFMLHPEGRVSEVQRRQMTTVLAPNVRNIAIQGSFDDCQDLVKAMFADGSFRDEMRLGAVNSINWGRIMAQIVYYFYAALQLGAPDREVSFTVPTGNFGNIFAGLAAKRMGLPIEKLIIATNANDILDRTLKSGRYEITGVVPTTSPSMDIQVSSNFERLVYLANDRDTSAVRAAMNSLSQSQSFTIKSPALKSIRSEFTSGAVNETETAQTMMKILQETGELIDPHTAVGIKVAYETKVKSPMVTLSTAHPAKFPDAVKSATGQTPRLPSRLEHLMTAPESFKVLPNSAAAVKDFILQQDRG